MGAAVGFNHGAEMERNFHYTHLKRNVSLTPLALQRISFATLCCYKYSTLCLTKCCITSRYYAVLVHVKQSDYFLNRRCFDGMAAAKVCGAGNPHNNAGSLALLNKRPSFQSNRFIASICPNGTCISGARL